uniref:Lipinlike protein putative n=1 Tax=Albugo laibachii Nc14 TaxID=890382 RepID=F0WI38_9STRA|nr:lipinlike protein putative [Albugo laibachii Nc14]|eukprot:CCA20916.1 lipinlike protein putative [Albugo laibachii Nc14]
MTRLIHSVTANALCYRKYQHSNNWRLYPCFHRRRFVVNSEECSVIGSESVIVVDLDGTLTVSDVEGHIRTLRFGQYDFLQRGTCQFFTKLYELQMRVQYLTDRPLDWASASRNHLEDAIQLKHVLPPGPLITNSNGLTGALLTEVVNKNPHIFKRQVLQEIQLCLIHAGRVTEHPIFVAGFGNRSFDVLAYKDAGIELDMIFLIDSTSSIKCSDFTCVGSKVYESYRLRLFDKHQAD